jgi:hypothetical protein
VLTRAKRGMRWVSPSMFVAMLALFLASGGSAPAITGCAHCPTFNSIDIIDGTLTGADIKNHSLTALDFHGSLRGPRGLRGPAGRAGSAGAQGPKGDAGAAGAAGAQGPKGDAGAAGAKGDAGAAGAKGDAGAQGATGPAGAAGTARAYASVIPGSTPSFVGARTKNFTVVTHPAVQGTYCLAAAGIDARTVSAVASEEFDNTPGTGTANGIAIVSGSGSHCLTGQFEVITVDLTGAYSLAIAFNLIVP